MQIGTFGRIDQQQPNRTRDGLHSHAKSAAMWPCVRSLFPECVTSTCMCCCYDYECRVLKAFLILDFITYQTSHQITTLTEHTSDSATRCAMAIGYIASVSSRLVSSLWTEHSTSAIGILFFVLYDFFSIIYAHIVRHLDTDMWSVSQRNTILYKFLKFKLDQILKIVRLSFSFITKSTDNFWLVC